MTANGPSISNFLIQKTAEVSHAIKGTVEQDLPLTASQKQCIEKVLSRALSITVEDFRKYARNLEMIRMEDASKVIEGFHKHLRITSRAMEHCIVPLLDALPDVKVCNFVECHVEKGALVPFLKKKKKDLTDILITRTLTNNEADEVADVTYQFASEKQLREAWLRNETVWSSSTTREGPVKIVANPYYLPDDTDFAQGMHSMCPKVVGYPERMLLIVQRAIRFDSDGFTASYGSCPYDVPGLPIPIRLYEDIGFGPVDLTDDGLRPIDPNKTEEDIEIFITNAMEKLKPEIEVVIDKDSFLNAAEKGNAKENLERLGDTETLVKLRADAEAGNAAAQFELGMFFNHGKGGVQQSDEHAVEWWLKAAENGHAYAKSTLGNMYERGLGGLPKSQVKARECFEEATRQGDPNGQLGLGIYYKHGIGGLDKSDIQAVEWFRRAAEQGNDEALYQLGIFHDNGTGGVQKSDTKALECYMKAAEKGHAVAQCLVGLAYDNGKRGLKKSDSDAVKWYLKAAEQGNGTALTNLGEKHAKGLGGLTESREKAFEYYLKAADVGCLVAMRNVALYYRNGWGGASKSIKKAIEWYTKAAEKGDLNSQNSLGFILENGEEGWPKSEEKAGQWFLKAAEGGLAIAQRNVGLRYLNGRVGLPPSDIQAIDWFRKGAAQGDTESIYRLGFMYENGRGIPPSLERAKEWYEKASEKGHATAEERLKFLTK